MPTTFEEGAAYAAGAFVIWLLLALLIGARYAARLRRAGPEQGPGSGRGGPGGSGAGH